MVDAGLEATEGRPVTRDVDHESAIAAPLDRPVDLAGEPGIRPRRMRDAVGVGVGQPVGAAQPVQGRADAAGQVLTERADVGPGEGDQLVEGGVLVEVKGAPVEVLAEEPGLIGLHGPVDRGLGGTVRATGGTGEHEHGDEEQVGGDGEPVGQVGHPGLRRGDNGDGLGQHETGRAPEHSGERAGPGAADHDQRQFRQRDEEHVRRREDVGQPEHARRVEVGAACADQEVGDGEQHGVAQAEDDEEHRHGQDRKHGNPERTGLVGEAQGQRREQGAGEAGECEPVRCAREGTAENRFDQMVGQTQRHRGLLCLG